METDSFPEFRLAKALIISSYKLAGFIFIHQRFKSRLANIAVLVGYLLLCILAMLNGYVGCKYGINFPVLMRSAFGMYGAYFAVLIHGVLLASVNVYRICLRKPQNLDTCRGLLTAEF